MVIIDGTTGDIKFFQAKGYSIRNEDAGNLLRGQRYFGKDPEDTDLDVTGRRFLDLFDQSALSERLFAVLAGQEEQISNHLYEINKRPFICNIVPWCKAEKQSIEGVFLLIQDAEHLENLLDDRNEIIKQIEAKNEDTTEIEMSYPENAFEGFVGKSHKAREVKYMAYKASKNRFNVIITGESGTGKSKLAKEIHLIDVYKRQMLRLCSNRELQH